MVASYVQPCRGSHPLMSDHNNSAAAFRMTERSLVLVDKYLSDFGLLVFIE